MNEIEKADRGHSLNESIVRNELKRRELLVENIDALSEILDTQLYKVILGDENADWSGYLAQLDVFYTRAEVNRFIKIKRKLQGEFGFNLKDLLDIPVTRLEDVASFAQSKEAAEKLLDIARVATSQDWKEEISSVRGKPIVTRDDGHTHEFQKVCKICGEKHNLEE